MIFEKEDKITSKTHREINDLPKWKYEIVKRKKKRTLSQNKYYWKILTIRGKELGYYPEELHEVVKNEFIKRTTTESDTIEFWDFIDYVIHQASLDGVVIRDVEEYKANFNS